MPKTFAQYCMTENKKKHNRSPLTKILLNAGLAFGNPISLKNSPLKLLCLKAQQKNHPISACSSVLLELHHILSEHDFQTQGTIFILYTFPCTIIAPNIFDIFGNCRISQIIYIFESLNKSYVYISQYVCNN